MIIVPEHNSRARCVFSTCDHAPATKRCIHEFVNHADKLVCEYHAKLVERVMAPPEKRKVSR